MKNRISVLLRITHLLCLGCIVTMTWFLLEPRGVLALQPPPPPNTPTSTPMPTETSMPTDTPVPTETQAPTDTPMPTNTAIPEPENTDTPVPTETQAPAVTPTSEPPVVEATPTSSPGGAPAAANSTNCQSVIEGYVVDGSGQKAGGATVMAEAEGWSGAIATDDRGQFGFNGLCAGMATIQAFLPGGEATGSRTVALTGQNSVMVNLSTGAQPTDVPALTTPGESVDQAATTAEAGMPLTGFSGWLLSGAILLGVLMLLTAGARRVLNVYEPSED